MLQNAALPRFEIRRAARAISALLDNPDDLPQVFTIIESLSGTSPHRLVRAFRRTETGARLLRDRPDIVERLADREALRRLREGSLGRAYLDFVEREGVSAEGIRAASAAGQVGHPMPDALAYVNQRMRDTHDLWHAATGYHGDVLGEAALLAFNLGQHWHAGVALIVLAALTRAYTHGHAGVILDGFRRGRRAAWLPAQDWEALLERPLAEVRRELRLGDPPVYTSIRTSELRAQGLLAAA